MKVKPQLINKGKDIYFIDSQGREWNAEAIEDLIQLCDLIKKIKNKVEYYAPDLL